MPGNERLGQADVGGQLGDRGRARRETAHDPEPVHVGHGLVEHAQLAQLLGLGDGGSDRAADAGSRGGQGGRSGALTAVTSTTVYINRR